MLRRRLIRVGATISLALFSVLACSPAANIEPTAPFTQAWDGPVETIAIVMAEPDRKHRPLANGVMSLATATFARHPYARQRFDLVEREEIDRVLREHRLSTSGFVDRATAPMLGDLLGAQYILVVNLVGADIRESRVSGLDVAGVRLGGGTASISVSLGARLVDVQTGRVLANGLGNVQTAVMTGLSVDGVSFETSASREMVLDLIPEVAMRALNDIFRNIG